jgi:hypothetical protein
VTGPEEASDDLLHKVVYWSITFGAIGAIYAGFRWGWIEAAGVAAGVGLSLLNFRWLKQGVGALIGASLAQAGAEKVRVPRTIYLKLLGRFALLLFVIYVILWRFRVIAIAVVAGFFALVAGVMAAMISHLIRNFRQA